MSNLSTLTQVVSKMFTNVYDVYVDYMSYRSVEVVVCTVCVCDGS